jgi:hypothetical protein
MNTTRFFQLLCAGVVGLICTGVPARAYDPAQGARQSITESVRDDVRRRIQAREHGYRDSRAEYRRGSETPRRKIRIRRGADFPH